MGRAIRPKTKKALLNSQKSFLNMFMLNNSYCCFFLSFSSLLKSWSWHLTSLKAGRLSRFHRAIPSTFLDKYVCKNWGKGKVMIFTNANLFLKIFFAALHDQAQRLSE